MPTVRLNSEAEKEWRSSWSVTFLPLSQSFLFLLLPMPPELLDAWPWTGLLSMFFITPPQLLPGLDPPPPALCASDFHLLLSTQNIHLLRQARLIIWTVYLTPSCGRCCGGSAAFHELLSLRSSPELAISVCVSWGRDLQLGMHHWDSFAHACWESL